MCKVIKFGRLKIPARIYIEVRGFPNGIFNPWARWITGLALAKNSSVAVVAVVLALWDDQCENWKNMKNKDKKKKEKVK